MKAKFKKVLFIFLFISPIFLLSPSSLLSEAHSGRTDSQGGHHDYKNKSGLGSYHYHHGYPAHLHDGGVCPYGGADISSSSTGSSSSNTTKSEPVEKTDKITISNYDTSMIAGDRQSISFEITSDYSDEYKISSSNLDVVSVSGNTLYAKNDGTATITIKSYNNSKQFTVTVKSIPVEDIIIEEVSVKLQVGESKKIKINVTPNNATNKNIIWKTEDENIVKVSNGNLTAISEGNTKVTATSSNGIQKIIDVNTYVVEPDEINVSFDYLELEATAESNININILPENANDKTFSVKAANSNIVSVLPDKNDNNTFTITPKTDGETEIIINAWNGIEKKVSVKIYSIPLEKINIDDSKVPYLTSNIIDIKNQEIKLSYSLSPNDCTYKDVEWITSNDNVINIDNNSFKVVGTGKVTLTCCSVRNKSIYETLEITVINTNLIIFTIILIISLIILVCVVVFIIKKTQQK